MANQYRWLWIKTVTTVRNTPATSGQSDTKSGLGVGIFKNNPVSLNDGR